MERARIIHPPDARSPKVLLATVESTTSVFFAFVIGLFVLCGCLLGAVLSFREAPAAWIISASMLLPATAELFSLWWLKVGLEGTTGRGRIPELALLQRPWAASLRPVLAAWWLAHLCLGIGGMMLLEQAVSGLEVQWTESPSLMALVLFGYFTISHTTHLYGMLALTALARSERLVYGWWRKRFLVDVIVTALALGVSVFHKR